MSLTSTPQLACRCLRQDNIRQLGDGFPGLAVYHTASSISYCPLQGGACLWVGRLSSFSPRPGGLWAFSLLLWRVLCLPASSSSHLYPHCDGLSLWTVNPHGAAKGGSYPSFFGRGVYGESTLARRHALALAGMPLGGLLKITIWWYCSGRRLEQDVWLTGIVPFFVFAFSPSRAFSVARPPSGSKRGLWWKYGR